MNLQGLVQAPRLWVVDPRSDRRVTWMELFFDLIFVAAVAEVGSPLRADYSWAGLLRYSFLFVLIWWAWSGHTLYSTRFDHDDLVQRGLTLLQCFIAAVMAANAKEALDSRSSAGFGAAYAGMRIVLVLQYIRARRVPETRPLTTRYAIGFGTAALLWIISALLEAPERYWVWALALAVDFLTPWLAVKHSMKFPPDATHFPERFGLFTIILLGEFVAAVMRGIESQEYWSFSAAATAFSSMAFAFVLRWWYFDVGQSASERHIRSRRHEVLFQVWHYAHLPLFLGIGVAGVGFERMISLQSGERLTPAEAWVLCSAVAVLMAALISIGATSESSQRHRRRIRHLCAQYGLIGLAGLLGFTAAGIPRVILVAGLLAACSAQTLLGRSAILAPNGKPDTPNDGHTKLTFPHHALLMNDARYPAPIKIRPAVRDDADGIARAFLESAEYHAELDPERYSPPAVETISARYRERRQHPSDAGRKVMTLVAELSGEIVGFIDARLEQSPDAMHREMTYCVIAEIAVRREHRSQGIGGRLLRAAEHWGCQLGADFALLEYHTANARAGLFYQERMGYRRASITAIKRL